MTTLTVGLVKSRAKVFSIFLLIILSGCGGSGSSDSAVGDSAVIAQDQSQTDVDNPFLTVKGMAVQGPLANALINLYVVDPLAANLKGRLVANGTSDSRANFTALEIERPQEEWYLLEVTRGDDTVDLNTHQQPVMESMQVLLSQDQLQSSVFASPLTTLATQIVIANLARDDSSKDIVTDIAQAYRIIETHFSFGLEAFDAQSTSPILFSNMTDDDVLSVISHRTSIEAAVAVLHHLSVRDGKSMDELISILASGLILKEDSGIDSAVAVQIAALPVASLPIPYTDKDGNGETDDPYTVDEVELLLVHETQQLENDVDLSLLAIEGINLVPTTIVVTDAEDVEILRQLCNDDTRTDLIACAAAAIAAGVDVDAIVDAIVDDTQNPVNTQLDGPALEEERVGDKIEEQVDSDFDGLVDSVDSDDDNDLVLDVDDAFPLDFFESRDTDLDGLGDNADIDDDNDGVVDSIDLYPFDKTKFEDPLPEASNEILTVAVSYLDQYKQSADMVGSVELSDDKKTLVFNESGTVDFEIESSELSVSGFGQNCRFNNGSTKLKISSGLSHISIECRPKLLSEVYFQDRSFGKCVNDSFSSSSLQRYAHNVRTLACANTGIYSISGVEHLSALTYLDLSNHLENTAVANNRLTSINVTQNRRLTMLAANNNSLSTVYLPSESAVEKISLNGNYLTKIDLRGQSTLRELYLSSNRFTRLDLSPIVNVKKLKIDKNYIRSIDLSELLALESLSLADNQIDSIDLSHNGELRHLLLDDNQLSAIDLSTNSLLSYLLLSRNQFANLDVSFNSELQKLYLSGNQLTDIDVDNNTALVTLWIEDQQPALSSEVIEYLQESESWIEEVIY